MTPSQYLCMRTMLGRALSANSFLYANPSDSEVASFFFQLITEASGAVALDPKQQSAITYAFRGALSGNFSGVSNPNDADVLAFWTQLSTDSAGATALAVPRYNALKQTLLDRIALNYPGTTNPSLQNLLGYIGAVAGASLGLVATRCGIYDTVFAGAFTAMQRFGTFAMDNITALKVVWPNWVGDETGGGNVSTITASIEYPAGTFTQLKFGGSVAGVAQPATNLYSDLTTIPGGIPSGAKFWVRFFRSDSANYYVNNATLPNTSMGDALNLGGTDQTMGGTVTNNANGIITPAAIIGLTSKRSVAILGDSRQAGFHDDFQAANGGWGELGTAFAAQYAYTDLGLSSHTAFQFTGAHALRDDIVQWATDVVNAYGVNDLFLNHNTAAQVEALQTAIRGYYPTKRYYLATLDPETTSTDSWATTTNQTSVNATDEAQRIIYNTDVRATALGFNGYFDCAAVSESSLNSGKWKVDGTANKYTSDGIHPSPFCYRLYSFSLP